MLFRSVNLESAWAHPCQGLSDAALMTEHLGDDLAGKNIVLSWAPHPKPLPMAVPNTALRTAARCGMNVTVARPDTHALDPDLMAEAQSMAEAQGGSVSATSDQDAAASGADVVYAKSWGGPLMYEDPTQEAEARAAHADWRITEALMARTRDGASRNGQCGPRPLAPGSRTSADRPTILRTLRRPRSQQHPDRTWC